MHIEHARGRKAAPAVPTAVDKGVGVHLGNLGRLEPGDQDGAKGGQDVPADYPAVPFERLRRNLGPHMVEPPLHVRCHGDLSRFEVGAAL